MNKTAIKNFAIQSRVDLIKGVTQKAFEIGVTEEGTIKRTVTSSDAFVVNGQLLDTKTKKQREALLTEIATKGFKQVMEEVAYTWFNRFIALRFMEVNGYLPSRIRVFTNIENEFKPEILAEALHLQFTNLDKDRVITLFSQNKNEELYKYLLIAQCNDLNNSLPDMFERIENYTEVLFPDGLLKNDSILAHMIIDIPEEDWKEQVEIIGWLYQFYNTELKDETYALLKKNVKLTKERIPSVTQLFTPDWIVRYMVENSLGRLWVESHPNVGLTKKWKYYLEEAEQEKGVKEKIEIIREEYKALKPEDIKFLEPCMGSGHVLVYAFDVFMNIYTSQGYTEIDATKLIIEKNLYGLDIDNRAFQLSYFAIMMKARQYNRRILNGNIKPHLYSIQESNFLSSELIDFISNGDSSIKSDLNYLLKTFMDAKEFGSILVVNPIHFDSIYQKVDQIKYSHFTDIFSIEFQKITLEKVVPLIQQAELFSKEYDVVVTNPPYMGSNSMDVKLSGYIKEYYPNSKSDLFSVFLEKNKSMTKKCGYYAMIVQPSFLFLSSFENLRKSVLTSQSILSLLHMGRGIFGIDFGSVTFVIKNISTNGYRGQFFKLHERTFQFIEPTDIETLYLMAKKDHEYKFDFSNYIAKDETNFDNKENIEKTINNDVLIYYNVNQNNFIKIPGSPIAYWASKEVLRCFSEEPQLGSLIEPRQGLATTENNRFIRLWFEVSINLINFGIRSTKDAESLNVKWVPYNKGGARRQWYGNYDYIVDWSENGKAIKENVLRKYPYLKTPDFVVKNTNYYFREAITWPLITSGGFSVRYREAGSIHDVSGMSAFSEDNSKLLYILGVLSTKISGYFFKMLNPTINLQVGDFNKFPIIFTENNKVLSLVNQCIDISREDWNSFESSWNFSKHPLIKHQIECNKIISEKNSKSSHIQEAFQIWEKTAQNRFDQVKENEVTLNDIFIELYDLKRELTNDILNEDITIFRAESCRDMKSFISYAVGCMFGRYSLDNEGLIFAGREWNEEMYNVFKPDIDNVIPISDDDYFEDDIVSRFVKFVSIVYGEETLEVNLSYIANILDKKGTSSREVIRDYFLNNFFSEHLKTYQKRPIYWLFDSGKENGFKALIYMHRYQSDLLSTMRVDYVHEQQERYRTQISHLEDTVITASQTDKVKTNKRLETLRKQIQELKVYEEKLQHFADQKIEIDLDDGVVANYAKFGDLVSKIK